MGADARERVVRTSRAVPLGAVVGTFRRGGGDPTSRRDDRVDCCVGRTPGRTNRPAERRTPCGTGGAGAVHIGRGEPVLESKLAPPGTTGGLSAVVASGKRAIVWAAVQPARLNRR